MATSPRSQGNITAAVECDMKRDTVDGRNPAPPWMVETC